MIVFKDNILVEPVLNKSMGDITLNDRVLEKNVEQRKNLGVVIAISDGSNKVKIGDYVGYASSDGVNVKNGLKKYVLLSKRETLFQTDELEGLAVHDHERYEGIDRLVSKHYHKREGVKL